MSIIEKALTKTRADRLIEPLPRVDSGAPRIASTLSAPSEPPKRSISLDQRALREQGLAAPEEFAARIREDFRRVKFALAQQATRRGAAAASNLIMVTSALPGEGKTFSAYNLALSIAIESDRQVWLVDADGLRPQLSRACGIESERGLLDVIVDEISTLEDVLIGTDVPGLCIVGSGQSRPDAPELLGGTRTAQLLTAVGRKYRDVVVVVDTPPILATTVPQALAPVEAQVLVIVKAGSTPRSAVSDAIQHLRRTEDIALVLNHVPRAFGRDYYSEYYSGAKR